MKNIIMIIGVVLILYGLFAVLSETYTMDYFTPAAMTEVQLPNSIESAKVYLVHPIQPVEPFAVLLDYGVIALGTLMILLALFLNIRESRLAD